MTHTDVIVTGLSQRSNNGWLRVGHQIWPCALGRAGRGHLKREGDGLTPIGRWPIRQVWFRADRRLPLARPAMPDIKPVRPMDGWCDAVGDRNYNRFVRHPYPASAEQLWRDDHLYDVVVVLGHNDRPRKQGGGSAIFLHVAEAAEDGSLKPTAGCIALRPRDLRTVLHKIRPDSFVRVVG